MPSVYPLRPVVCNAPQWRAYDDHPMSVQLASACISTDEARRLVDEGADFESIVLLNDVDERLDAALKRCGTRVNRLRLHPKWPGALERIHGVLADRPASHFQFVNAG